MGLGLPCKVVGLQRKKGEFVITERRRNSEKTNDFYTTEYAYALTNHQKLPRPRLCHISIV